MISKKQLEIAHKSLLISSKVAKVTAKRLRRNQRRRKINYSVNEWEEMAMVKRLKAANPLIAKELPPH